MKIYYKFQTFLRKPDAEKMCYLADKKHSGILDAAEDVVTNKKILGNIRSLRTHLKNMASESPYKAIIRIDKYMGYGEYLKANNIDDNKLFILKMLAKKEDSITSFLDRLSELRTILSEKETDYRCKFILSTIHSSKGLEYDTVYLIDVINGVFPGRIIRSFATATPKEKRENEEERRLFYVGMTRARDRLYIFKYDDKPSVFVGEITKPDKQPKKKASPKKVLNQPTMLLKKKEPASASSENAPRNLIIGERVMQPKYGKGYITDVVWDDDEIPLKFTVEFDDGNERIFMYPAAFRMGMKILEE